MGRIDYYVAQKSRKKAEIGKKQEKKFKLKFVIYPSRIFQIQKKFKFEKLQKVCKFEKFSKCEKL